MNPSLRRRALALVYGALCHGLFLFAVTLMAANLWSGMGYGVGPFHGGVAWIANTLLLLQFPLLHSYLLTRSGRRVMGRLAPAQHRGALAPTTYALLAALQIATTFGLWSPSGVVLWEPTGLALALHRAAFVGAWLFLGKALFDAGLGLQTGWIGWSAVWKERSPRYPALPVTGLFRRCRQPIYLGFALVLWTGPAWTPDHLAIAILWGAYCVVGPLHKERRFAALYGKDFEAYRREVPYLVPRLHS